MNPYLGLLAENKRLRERIAADMAAAQQEIRVKQQEIQSLNQLAISARQQQLAIEASKQNSMIALAVQGSQGVLNTAVQFWQNMMGLAQQAVQQTATASASSAAAQQRTQMELIADARLAATLARFTR